MWIWPITVGLLGLVVVLLLMLRQQRTNDQWRIATRRPDLATPLSSTDAPEAPIDFEQLADALDDPVILISARHRILYQNPIARQLWPPLPTGSTSLIEATRVYELDDYAADVLRERNELPREITLNAHLFRVSGARITRSDGTIGALLILRDISELQRLGRARRDFVANISHELRTPLTAIRLLADTLKVRYQIDDADAQKLLAQISDQTDTLTQLTQELYDLTQIESGSMPMRMISIDLRELVDGVVSRLSPQAERAGLILRNDIPENVRGLIDATQIARGFPTLSTTPSNSPPKGVRWWSLASPSNHTWSAPPLP